MSDLFPIDFACNDPDDGLPMCAVQSIMVGDNELERHTAVAFAELDGRVRIHRREFAFTHRKEWVGNWCWNRYMFERAIAEPLIGHLARHDWRCTSGEHSFRRFFERSAA